MDDQTEAPRTQTAESSNPAGLPSSFGYCLITFFVLLYYVGNYPFYYEFTNTILPAGDPFTYTIGFFKLIEWAQHDFWAALKAVLTDWNWLWMMNLSMVFLSPFLVKDPYSMSIANFIMYGLATASFYRLARRLNFDTGKAFLLSMLLWLYPINYGFVTYSSIPVLALDAMFSGCLYLALAAIFCFMYEPERYISAIIAGVCAGLALWARGNSIVIVGFVSFIPVLYILARLKTHYTPRLVKAITIYAVTALTMGGYFYWTYWVVLSEYYIHHQTFVERHAWNLHDALQYLKNIPGFMFWRNEDSFLTISLSFFWHLVVILITVFFFLRRTRSASDLDVALRRIAYTGAFIYFGTYFINIALFTDPLITIYNALLIYRPMLIGLNVSLFAILGHWMLVKRVNIGQGVMLATTLGVLAFALLFTHLQTPRQLKVGRPSPQEVERFALNLDELTGGKPYSMIWYNNYSPRILSYYRIKNGLKDIPDYNHKNWNSFWDPSDHSQENRLRIREDIPYHFKEASVIIIPEYSDLYYKHQPYAVYQFSDEIVNFINSPDCPKLVVVDRLMDHPKAPLVVLKRAEDVNGIGEPFKLPYGPRPDAMVGLPGNPAFDLNTKDHWTLKNVRFADSDLMTPVPENSFASRMLEEQTSENEPHQISKLINIEAGKAYTFSFFIKNAGRPGFRFQVSDMHGASGFSLDGKAEDSGISEKLSNSFGKAQLHSTTLTPLKGGWYRVQLTGTIDNHTKLAYIQIILAERMGHLLYSSKGEIGVYLAGFQVTPESQGPLKEAQNKTPK